MRKVDGYLSREAQAVWPTAIVWKEEATSPGNGTGGERFILERHDTENVLLGNRFGEAKAGLIALLSSERSRKQSLEGKEN